MKNYRLYPFERNRFFYGKLLTVRDFESEQRYFNDKRRMLNHLIHGSGVLCGLQVVAVDDKTISVEAGIALDQAGREIVVEKPVTMKLSMIEGFTNNDYVKNVYLCIEYDEKGREAVHSVAGTASNADAVSEYNRVQESYRLFIREEAPELSSINFSALKETTSFIYSEPHMKIWMEAPKYVMPGELFEVKLKVEKAIQVQEIDFELRLGLEGLTSAEGRSEAVVSFKEPANSKETEYGIGFMLKAGKIAEEPAKIFIKAKDSNLKEGDKNLKLNNDSLLEIETGEESPSKKIFRKYYEQTLDKCMEYNAEQCIYLAKIVLLQVGPTFIIEKVEQVPFDQYIYNTSLLNRVEVGYGSKNGVMPLPELGRFKAQMKCIEPEKEPNVKLDFNKESGELDFKFEIPTPKVMFGDITTGFVDVSLGNGAKAGDCFYSEEIDHNLGAGNVFIVLGVVENSTNILLEMANEEEKIYIGDLDIFSENINTMSVLPSLSAGALIYPKKGRFIAGVKIKSATRHKKIRLRWWAYKKLSDAGRAKSVSVFADTDTIEVAKGQTFNFRAVVEGAENKSVSWRVKQNHGGTIDQDGLYTAPDIPGTFEVEVISNEDPTKSGTAIVIVK